MKKAPLEIVKEKFEDKAGLIKAVKELASKDLWVERVNADKGLECVSNQKLLRLHAALTEVKERFGSREGLVDALLKQLKREKDEGYKGLVERWSTPRLLDALRSAARKA